MKADYGIIKLQYGSVNCEIQIKKKKKKRYAANTCFKDTSTKPTFVGIVFLSPVTCHFLLHLLLVHWFLLDNTNANGHVGLQPPRVAFVRYDVRKAFKDFSWKGGVRYDPFEGIT